jgi:hypothetical protein
MSTPIHYDTFDAEWAEEGISFADYCAYDLAFLLPQEVVDQVAAKLQLIAPSLETEWQRLEAEWQRLEAAKQAEAQAESLRLEAVNKAFALVIGELQDRLTKRARTEAIHV